MVFRASDSAEKLQNILDGNQNYLARLTGAESTNEDYPHHHIKREFTALNGGRLKTGETARNRKGILFREMKEMPRLSRKHVEM